MLYKDIQYSVVQTIGTARWKWTIEIEPGRTRSGAAATRLMAIRQAERAIDKAIKVKRTKPPPMQ
jgi:hypothetical protein